MGDLMAPAQHMTKERGVESARGLSAISPKLLPSSARLRSQGAWDCAILWNLISSPFGGTVYPVNPNRPNVLGIRSYPRIAEVPEPY